MVFTIQRKLGDVKREKTLLINSNDYLSMATATIEKCKILA